MPTIRIFPDSPDAPNGPYTAALGDREATGATPGQALDALTAHLGGRLGTTLVIIQSFEPDEFFTAEQQQRLRELLDADLAARRAGASLPADLTAELTALARAEMVGAARRSAALLTPVAS